MIQTIDMKRILQILLFVVSTSAFSQEQFNIELTAPLFEKDSLFLAPPPTSRNIISLYSLTLNENNKNVKSIGNSKGALIKILPQNNISGIVPCPLPMMIMSSKEDRKGFYLSELFFIENGNLKVQVSDKNLTLVLPPDATINNDYKKLKKYLQQVDEKLKPFEKNDPADLETKEKLLKAYIRKNPGSYPAFWEIIDVFSKYGFHKSYLTDLPLFSKKIKASSCFKDFEKIMYLENSTNVGGNFPEIDFGSEGKITKEVFSNYKITMIDYWSTSCKPCIQELPELVKLYEKYKDKGVNFISVADEKTQQRIDLATKIFQENNVSWKNYFDTTKEFTKKLNAGGYPLFIVVDQNGKILSKELGGQETLETVIEQHLK
jgi:thiol-disulfide isomerase/thioredoxin